MTDSFDQIVRRHCRPMEPIPTGELPVARELDDVRVVLFDIYGTLLISASGDIATSQAVAQGQAFVAALRAVDIDFRGDAEAGLRMLLDEIAADHRRSRRAGVDYPEVDIIEIWRRVLVRLVDSSLMAGISRSDLERLALEYEIRVNPVWPMPHARQCLVRLHAAGLALGVISNAQFLTIGLWRSLLRADTVGFVFDEELQYYSYRHGGAKPGLGMFRMAADVLARRDIRANQVLYVGNDMLNDMMPAGVVGFRTALFAGDARSLRRRENDPRVAGVTPDIVITDLSDLAKCIC